MEYIDGKTFSQVLDAIPDHRLTLIETVTNLKPIFQALKRMHDTIWFDDNGVQHTGIIHRDVSPENIMFAKDGTVKLMDFGAARNASMRGTQKLTGIIKAGYAPPEQFIGSGEAGAQGPWTDIYALAATIYRSVTGIRPQSSQQRQIHDDLQLPSSLKTDISPAKESVLLKGMALDYHCRYQTIEKFYHDLIKKDDYQKDAPIPTPTDKKLIACWGNSDSFYFNHYGDRIFFWKSC